MAERNVKPRSSPKMKGNNQYIFPPTKMTLSIVVQPCLISRVNLEYKELTSSKAA